MRLVAVAVCFLEGVSNNLLVERVLPAEYYSLPSFLAEPWTADLSVRALSVNWYKLMPLMRFEGVLGTLSFRFLVCVSLLGTCLGAFFMVFGAHFVLLPAFFVFVFELTRGL